MMPAKYVALNGTIKKIDLDAVVDILEGNSFKHKGWSSLIIYSSENDAFIELRDSPSDIRGNSQSECEEISPQELAAHYGINEMQCAQIRRDPRGWKLIDLRK